MIKALNRFSRLVRVPADLASVTVGGAEVADLDVGLAPGTAEALWQRAVKLYASGVQPAMQLCVHHRGQVILNRAIGHAHGNAPGARAAQPTPIALDTPINLFSCGKAVTAALMHKLEELGLLSLDAPVADYIPEFARHGKGAITVRQVLTHRGGIAQLPKTQVSLINLDKLADPAAISDILCDLRPATVGGAPGYHAISGGFVMAEIMRRVAGEPRALLKQYLKDPLGLQWLDFGVTADQVPLVAENACTGFMSPPIAWHLGRVVGAEFSAAVDMSNDPRFLTAVVPSGNVISTAQDCAVFYQCLLNDGAHNGQQVFKPETIRAMRKPDDYGATLDRTIGIPIRYSRGGFMIGHTGIGLFGLNQHHTFGHFGLSSTLTWARADTGTVVCWLTTGKPVLGPHIPEMLGMFSGFNALCENRLA